MICIGDITFTIYSYDSDGNAYEEGFYMHFGDTRILLAKDLGELDSIQKRIASVIDDMKTYDE